MDFLSAFDAVFRKAASNGLALKMTELCRLAANEPSPRFYVSTKTALCRYKRYKEGRCVIHNTEMRKMYAEIFTRYEKLMEICGGSVFSSVLMERVLQESAPSFYLTPKSAVQFYYTAMAHKREGRHR